MLKRSKLNFALILMLAISAIAVTASTPSANQNEIVIQNFSFEPAILTVKVGTTVTWVNKMTNHTRRPLLTSVSTRKLWTTAIASRRNSMRQVFTTTTARYIQK